MIKSTLSQSWLNKKINKKKKILFLGYHEKQTRLINYLRENNYIVFHKENRILEIDKKFDLVICFGYRYLLKKETINKLNCLIINLHISLLPYNRGAHPNFWSFFHDTPKGVTIHMVDEGLDTGKILFQKKIFFSKKEITFRQTYERLFNEIEDLFIDKINDIFSRNFILKSQGSGGSYNKKNSLPHNFSGWNSVISQEIKKLKKEGLKYDKKSFSD